MHVCGIAAACCRFHFDISKQSSSICLCNFKAFSSSIASWRLRVYAVCMCFKCSLRFGNISYVTFTGLVGSEGHHRTCPNPPPESSLAADLVVTGNIMPMFGILQRLLSVSSIKTRALDLLPCFFLTVPPDALKPLICLGRSSNSLLIHLLQRSICDRWTRCCANCDAHDQIFCSLLWQVWCASALWHLG